MRWLPAALCLPLLVAAGGLPTDAIEGTAVLADCATRSVSAYNGTGIGNLGLLLIPMLVDNRAGGAPCQATLRITDAVQIGPGSSRFSYDAPPDADCVAPAAGICSTSLEVAWTYCGDADGVRWHFEVLFETDTPGGTGHVDALTVPESCDLPQ